MLNWLLIQSSEFFLFVHKHGNKLNEYSDVYIKVEKEKEISNDKFFIAWIFFSTHPFHLTKGDCPKRAKDSEQK